MPKPGDVLAGRFHISRQIGQGGLAQVFEAEQLDLGRRVVIKTLRQPFAKDPVLLTRFRREARAAACIHHPNVTSVSALYEPPGEPPFLVMDLVDGETLHDAFRVSGPMDAQRLIPILMQLLDGLAAAHARGIVHRDLKPRNVMLTRTASIEDFVHIVDFGIAAVLHPTDGPLTVRGEMIGTPGYMAPEQVTGEPVTPSSDLFAVGVIAYLGLCGRLPFGGGTAAERLIALHYREAPPLTELRPDLDPALAAIVHRALEKDGGRRFTSANEMARALRRWSLSRRGAYESPAPATTLAPTWVPPPPRPSKSPPLPLVLALALAAPLAIALGFASMLLLTRVSADDQATSCELPVVMPELVQIPIWPRRER